MESQVRYTACLLALLLDFLAATITGTKRRVDQYQPDDGRTGRNLRNPHHLPAQARTAPAAYGDLSNQEEPLAAAPLFSPQPRKIRSNQSLEPTGSHLTTSSKIIPYKLPSKYLVNAR
jgi:hypothetical protein